MTTYAGVLSWDTAQSKPLSAALEMAEASLLSIPLQWLRLLHPTALVRWHVQLVL